MLKPAVLTLLALMALEALVSLRSGVALLRQVAAPRAPAPGASGRVALLVPCKGHEPGLEDNLRSLARQEHEALDVFVVTASADDGAAPVIRRLLREFPARLHWRVAGRRPGCAEKAANLLCAVEAAADATVIVTADSDGRVDGGWLARLLRGLPAGDGGPPVATTGYRWYVPAAGVGSWLQAAWNASALSLLARPRPPFVWGGATAIRRRHLEATDVLERWRTTVSDDFSLTRALEGAGGRIVFVADALVRSDADLGAWQALAWVRRQLLLTRVHAPALWRAVVGYQVLWTFTLAAGLALAPSSPVATLLVATTVVAAMAKGGVRHAAVARLLPDAGDAGPRLPYVLMAPLSGPVTGLAGIASALGRTLRWRGVVYRLDGPERTRVISRQTSDAATAATPTRPGGAAP